MTLTCPVCHTTGDPAAAIGDVVVCGGCGASLVVDGAGVRRATAAETTPLGEADRQMLRTARGRIVRPDRRQR